VLNEYIANLKEFKKLLENKNWSAMHEQMQEINAIKTILEGIPEGKNNYKN
jgi:tRNA nucleotidyltransferase/poly(A) polymerase